VKRLVAALFLAALAVPASAAADSIVYVDHGNLFLTSSDGARRYQLTSDGGYSSPSQADDGTIGAIRNRRLVRLDRAGRPLNAAVDAMGSDRGAIGGPYGARLSPDGTRFAYDFYVPLVYEDPITHERWGRVGSYGTWSYADRFTNPATESEYHLSLTKLEWLTNDRLLGTQGMYLNMWTWKLGTGHGYTWPAAQWWFGLRDPADDTGFAPYHSYDDPSVSRDGTRIAMTDRGQQLVVAATNGPAYSGEPPYAEVDYVNPESGFADPTITCRGPITKTDNPTWSADGSMLAYGAADGVHVIDADCTNDHLLIPGGSEPAFGPADVDPPQIAADPAFQTTPKPPPAAKLTLTKVSRHGTTIRFRLSAPARVTLAAGKRKRTVKGKAGINQVRFAPPRGARKLTITGPGVKATLRLH
jgi:hypothetical protein